MTSTDVNAPPLLAWHNDPDRKARALAAMAAHRAADTLVQDTYWQDGRGCAVGRLTEDPDGGHHRYPDLFGIPVDLAYLEDRIFEDLSREDAVLWPERFLSAIRPGADLSKVGRLFAKHRASAAVRAHWPATVSADARVEVLAWLDDDEALTGNPRIREVAREARRGMRSAAAAADDAADDARRGAWSRSADLLIELLEAA